MPKMPSREERVKRLNTNADKLGKKQLANLGPGTTTKLSGKALKDKSVTGSNDAEAIKDRRKQAEELRREVGGG